MRARCRRPRNAFTVLDVMSLSAKLIFAVAMFLHLAPVLLLCAVIALISLPLAVS